MKTFTARSAVMWLMILSAVLSGCSVPAPTPSVAPTATSIPPTDVPTAIPPTATAMPPTHTSTATATGTATQVPATATPVTPPKALASTATPKPVQVVAIPANSSLITTIQKTFEAASAIGIGLDQVQLWGYEPCDPLMANYTNVLQAPTFDVNQLSSQVQQAYAYYRNAIDTVASKAESIQRICNKGGGVIGQLDWEVARPTIKTAIDLLGRAVNLVKYIPGSSAASPVGNIVTQARVQIQDINSIFGTLKIGVVGQKLPASPADLYCPRFLADWNWLINAPTLDIHGQPANAQAAYERYRQAIALFKDQFLGMSQLCTTQEGKLTKAAYGLVRAALDEVDHLLADALNLLGQ